MESSFNISSNLKNKENFKLEQVPVLRHQKDPVDLDSWMVEVPCDD